MSCDYPDMYRESVTNLLPFIQSRMRFAALRREKHPDQAKDKLAFLNEFATVSLNFGRRAGHTTLARMILAVYSQAEAFVRTNDIAHAYFQGFEDRVHSTQIEKIRGMNLQGKIAVVDMATFVQKTAIDAIKICDPKFLILLE